MNLNRPFGNGRDYDQATGDESASPGVVDAPAAPNKAKNVTLRVRWRRLRSGSYDGLVNPPGSLLANNSLQARQLQARYLYVLMCMTCDLQYLQTQLGSTEDAARAWRNGRSTPLISATSRLDYDPLRL